MNRDLKLYTVVFKTVPEICVKEYTKRMVPIADEFFKIHRAVKGAE